MSLYSVMAEIQPARLESKTTEHGSASAPAEDAKANFSWRVRVGLIAFSLVALAFYRFGAPAPLRVLSSILFFCFIPGAAMLSCARRMDLVALASLSLTLSLSVCSTIAMIGVWARIYSADGMMWVTVIASVLLFAVEPLATRIFNSDRSDSEVTMQTEPPAGTVK